MRFPPTLLRLFIPALLVLVVSSCRNYDGSDVAEQQHPTLQKASKLIEQQDLPGAAALCQELLRKNPQMALAHLRLGMIYQSLNEPVKSLYHYQSYLELRPDSAKAEVIKQVIDDERKRLSMHFSGPVGAGELEANDPAAENRRLAAKLDETEQRLVKNRLEMEQLRLRLPGGENPPPAWAQEKIRLMTEVEELRRENTRLLSSRPAPTPTAAPLPQGPRMYTVQPGDTLGRIAQKMYGEASQWRKIQDANRDKISDLRNLKPGMGLVIP